MADEDLIQTFVEETKENLQIMEEGLLELETAPDNQDLVNVVFRAMHTIKGGAGLMGLSDICDVSHHMENILEELRQSGDTICQQNFMAFFTGVDLIKKMLDSPNFTVCDFQAQLDSLLQALVAVSSAPLPSPSSGETTDEQIPIGGQEYFYKISLKFRPDIFETGTDPLMLLLELDEEGEFLLTFNNMTNLPSLPALDPFQLYISWTVFFRSEKRKNEIDDIFIFVRDENDVTVEDITDQLECWFTGQRECMDMLEEQGIVPIAELEEAVERLKLLGERLEQEGYIVVDGLADEQFVTSSKVDDEAMLDIAKSEVAVTAAKTNVPGSDQNNTIRVDSRKLEGILNYLAEVLIAQSRVKDQVSKIPQTDKGAKRELLNSFEEVDKIIRRVQEEVMNTSMIPIGGTFSRFQRMARDLARDKGKEVEITLIGKETELDRKVIEQITDPLKHLIRNSIDHGIETKEERVVSGKNPMGNITLNAFHQEGYFVIEMSDDGRGIDEKTVLAKAVDKGLVEPDRTYTSNEINRFLFLPGFSTAKEVTDISGRGVGLDVVLTNINSLRGNIELTSEYGKGTKFSIRLPLTLAIIDGMMVRVGEERFVVPLNSIIEFIKAGKENINTVEGKGIVISLRNEFIPYAPLFKLLHLEAEFTTATDGILIILKEGSRKIALLVDEIIGQEQVVIKSMRDNLEQVDGIAGATILGDGKVAIILDISSLFRLTRKETGNKAKAELVRI